MISWAERNVDVVALRLVDLRKRRYDAAVDVVDRDDALARVDEMHIVVVAAMPEANATPCSALSSEARQICSAVRVGFATRE